MSKPKVPVGRSGYDLTLNLLAMVLVAPVVVLALCWRMIAHMWGRGTALWEELFAIIEGDGP